MNGCEIFENAQQARELLQCHGFRPLCRLGKAEHFVRGSRTCILAYEGDVPGQASLDEAEHVWFSDGACGWRIASF